jgi:hypothetical protein
VTPEALDRTVLGVVILSVCLGLGALLAIYWSIPGPQRAVAPAPLDKDGYTYNCYCFRHPVRVMILAPEERQKKVKTPAAQQRRRHARRNGLLHGHRIRPNHVSHAGADGGGRGESAPVTVAA